MKKVIDPENHGRKKIHKQPTTVEARFVDPVACGTSAKIDGRTESPKSNNRSASKGSGPDSARQKEKTIAKTAIQYVRSASGDKDSIRDQLKQTAKYAAQNGYQIVDKPLVDNGFSGLEALNRPAFSKMLSQIESGKANYRYVLMVDPSRLGRFLNPEEGYFYEYICNKHGVTILYTYDDSEIRRSVSEDFLRSLRRALETDPLLTPLSSQDQSR